MERYLQWLWYKNPWRNPLKTTEGKLVYILSPGKWNHSYGPDFLEATIEIEGTQWFGAVEVHTTSKEWYLHSHHKDPVYNQVILHVVYESDGKPIRRADGTKVFEVALKDTIAKEVWSDLCQEQPMLWCRKFSQELPSLVALNMVVRCAFERLDYRAERLLERLEVLKGDWQQLIWEQSLYYAGAPNNKTAFLSIAQQLPYQIISNYLETPEKAESLLLGVAGLLTPKDAYSKQRYQQWQSLKQLWQLTPLNLPLRWNGRCFNHPTLRLVQTLYLIAHLKGVEKFLDPQLPPSLKEVKVPLYWQQHYAIGKPLPMKGNAIPSLWQRWLINLYVPLQIAWNAFHNRATTKEWILSVLERLPAEHNHITKLFHPQILCMKSALESQGILSLYKDYCLKERCWECLIGSYLLRCAVSHTHNRSAVNT